MKTQDFNKLTDREKLDYLHETGRQMRAAQKQLNKVKKASLVTYWANAVMNWQDMYDALIFEHQKVIDAEKAQDLDKQSRKKFKRVIPQEINVDTRINELASGDTIKEDVKKIQAETGKTPMLDRALDQAPSPMSAFEKAIRESVKNDQEAGR